MQQWADYKLFPLDDYKTRVEICGQTTTVPETISAIVLANPCTRSQFVPAECAVDGRKYYQFTAVDECTRWTYRQMYDEHSTYSAEAFLIELIQRCPFPIREIQTDNGTEFTKALISNDPNDKSLFERKLKEYDILYHRIRIATPRHNGKVERQHRIDQQRFYNRLRMFSLEDGRRQLAVYQKKSNDYIKHCLGLRSPNQVLENYLAVM